jgi:hypothetical protein
MKVDLGDRSKILILLLLVGTAGIIVPGCGDPVAPVEVEPTTPRKTAEQLAQEQEQRGLGFGTGLCRLTVWFGVVVDPYLELAVPEFERDGPEVDDVAVVQGG